MNASKRMELEAEEALSLALASGAGINQISERTGISPEDILAASKGDIILRLDEMTLKSLKHLAHSSYARIKSSPSDDDDAMMVRIFESMFGDRKKFA